MKVTMFETVCVVEREPGDPKFTGVKDAKGESRLLYHVQKELKKQGYDFIKKRMWKDGHLVSSLQQYLRERNKNGDRCLAIWNSDWDILRSEESFNRKGVTYFSVIDMKGNDCTNKMP